MKKPEQIAKLFSPQRILLAVLLGLFVSIYMIFRDFDLEKYKSIHWGLQGFMFLLLAIILMFIRDLAYMYRIRVLTDNEITWKHSFQVIMLWEFSSALTPSVVGGSAAALFFVTKELKSAGKATAIVMITALMDELFYIIMVPLVIIFVGVDSLFIQENYSFSNGVTFTIQGIFWLGYAFIFVLTSIISFAIFVKPALFKKFLITLFSLPLLKRWKSGAVNTGNEIVITSGEMKGRSNIFWIKVLGATFLSWTARFWVVNMLILSFTGGGNQMLIYARQLVMWVVLLISPTPGGSGVAEIILPSFVGEYMGVFSDEIALVWRLISYYSYLIIGALVLTIWLKRIYKIHL